MTSPDDTAKIVAGFDKLAMLAEATAGYRAKLISGGIGPESADRMAEEYHTALMKLVEGQMAAQLDALRAVAAAAKTTGRGGVFPRRGQ